MLLKLALGLAAFSLEAQQTLSLSQAVDAALQGPGNLDVQLAKSAVLQAQARADQAHALLLPNLSVGATELDQARNLNAEGFRFANLPGFSIPAQVGPYNTFDARASLQQSVFNAAALARQKAFRLGTEAQKLNEQQTREVVAASVARTYLEILRHRTLLQAIRADTELAESKVAVLRQTLEAGKAVPVEITTAVASVRQFQIRQSAELLEYQKAKLSLLSICNLDLATAFEPVDLKPWDALNKPAAVKARADIASAESSVDSARITDRALRLERLPTVSAFADAGVLGGVETHTVGVSVNLTIFDGGRLAARRAEALSALNQEQIRLKQLQQKAQLERAQAALQIASATQELEFARQNLSAAEEDLQHTQRLVSTGGFDRTLELDARNRSAHFQVDEALAQIKLAEAQVAEAEATGSVTELISRSAR